MLHNQLITKDIYDLRSYCFSYYMIFKVLTEVLINSLNFIENISLLLMTHLVFLYSILSKYWLKVVMKKYILCNSDFIKRH